MAETNLTGLQKAAILLVAWAWLQAPDASARPAAGGALAKRRGEI